MKGVGKNVIVKPVRNSVVIDPIDDDLETMANAIFILNEYKLAGFVKREVFVETIMDEDRTYHTLPGMNKLNHFWAGRTKDSELNKDLIRILEKLKAA